MRQRKGDTKKLTRPEDVVATVVPQSLLRRLNVSDIKPSANNPRLLFDKAPLSELKENIRRHGVLVPITVYQIKGQNKYAILDGERRYKCCADLQDEGQKISIPANVVDPPTSIAGLLYMFSIHNFREQWELMPTALSLQVVMDALGERENSKLSKLTGLSEPQVERCKTLLKFPKHFQDLSLDPDPTTRIPSNFWIEADPLLDLCARELPDLSIKLGRDGITQKLVEKYQVKRIKSVIHFRRILEAYDLAANDSQRQKQVIERIREYIMDVQLETRRAFDHFVVDSRRVQDALRACDDFIFQLERAKLEHALDRNDLIASLRQVSHYVAVLLTKLEGSDEPGLGSTGGEVEASKE